MTLTFIIVIWIVLSLLGFVTYTSQSKVTLIGLIKRVSKVSKKVDPYIQNAVGAMLTCAPQNCSRQASCFRVAIFARDYLRELHEKEAYEEKNNSENSGKYLAAAVFDSIGNWEMG